MLSRSARGKLYSRGHSGISQKGLQVFRCPSPPVLSCCLHLCRAQRSVSIQSHCQLSFIDLFASTIYMFSLTAATPVSPRPFRLQCTGVVFVFACTLNCRQDWECLRHLPSTMRYHLILPVLFLAVNPGGVRDPSLLQCCACHLLFLPIFFASVGPYSLKPVPLQRAVPDFLRVRRIL